MDTQAGLIPCNTTVFSSCINALDILEIRGSQTSLASELFQTNLVQLGKIKSNLFIENPVN
jgi:hypothetical protein